MPTDVSLRGEFWRKFLALGNVRARKAEVRKQLLRV